MAEKTGQHVAHADANKQRHTVRSNKKIGGGLSSAPHQEMVFRGDAEDST